MAAKLGVVMTVHMTKRDRAILREARNNWWKILSKKREACITAEGDEQADEISRLLYLVSSEKRAHEMVSLLEHASSADVVLQVFLEHWPNCDDTWSCNNRLLLLLRKATGQLSTPPYYTAEQRAFFDDLPETVTVHRGCSRARVAGISWTTELSVAMQFARGHRGIRVPQPVIATAQVLKNEIFAVLTDRSESAVVCSPPRILKIEPCQF
jgi:hypothetical protein